MGSEPLFSLGQPMVNPVSRKARSIPILNPVNVYGRVFFLSWFGFFLAFWSWYAFPPLLTDVIAADVHMTPNDIKNSNIVGLIATLLVRATVGPLCDRYGARLTFVGTLLAGVIPTFCAGGATNVSGVMAIRFFVGILGGSFVPCQAWTTTFFDNNVIGTANALTAGFGNAGGGVTYFLMPAIFNSLVSRQHQTPHVAWRVAFIVPGIMIVAVALCVLLLCPDTPTGKWSERQAAVDANMRTHHLPGVSDAEDSPSEKQGTTDSANASTKEGDTSGKKKDVDVGTAVHFGSEESHLTADQMLDIARGEVVRKPTVKETLRIACNIHTLVPMMCYLCSFGSELSINSILGAYYTANSPASHKLTVQESGNWAAMFGLLNVVFRPLGGLVADLGYRYSGNLWSKKILLHVYQFIMAIFLIVIGKVNPHSPSTLYGLVAGLAFFLEGANGITFAFVPHVHPFANGVVSGFTGASGNLGGILFSVVFRFQSVADSFWILGVVVIIVNVLVLAIPPIPKSQVGGK